MKSDPNTIRIFVATDQRMGKSDVALYDSIRKNVTPPFRVFFMRSGTPGWRVGKERTPDVEWNIGRRAGIPYSAIGWATDFSCFRFAVPQLCDFRGKAIYMDTDFIVLGDLRPLWEEPMSRPVLSPSLRTDLMLMDCEAFKYASGWPSIEEMQASGDSIRDYIGKLQGLGLMDELHPNWECWDGAGFNEFTKTIHFTNMHTQPWMPYPEYFKYPPHKCQQIVDLWDSYYKSGVAYSEAKVNGLFEHYRKTPSNIAHYLTTLKELASRCGVVCEFGVERGRSSTALILGAQQHVYSWDTVITEEAANLSNLCPHKWTLTQGDSAKVEIPECDMLFIDSLHNGQHLRQELLNAGQVRKYIALHDTTACGEMGTKNTADYLAKHDATLEGLRPAINDFLRQRPEWTTVIDRTDHPGLTVLERK